MGQRGRKSTSELSIAAPDISGRIGLSPPPGLPPDVRKVFLTTVARVGNGHLQITDTDLLVRHAQAVILADKAYKAAAGDMEAFSRWERATKQVAMLAVKLKLTPSSRSQYVPVSQREQQQGISPADFIRLYQNNDDAA